MAPWATIDRAAFALDGRRLSMCGTAGYWRAGTPLRWIAPAAVQDALFLTDPARGRPCATNGSRRSRLGVHVGSLGVCDQQNSGFRELPFTAPWTMKLGPGEGNTDAVKIDAAPPLPRACARDLAGRVSRLCVGAPGADVMRLMEIQATRDGDHWSFARETSVRPGRTGRARAAVSMKPLPSGVGG